MTLNEYQAQAMSTCMKSCDNFSYMMLNLVGEVGEFASKVAKQVRKEKLIVGGNVLRNSLITSKKLDDNEFFQLDIELQKEAGDILWQLAGLCKVMGWELEEVAQANLNKLASRKERGVIE